MSFQDLAKNGGRELSQFQNQGTREVEALVFNLTSRVAQLRRLVDILGTPKDTIDHRHKIADINASIQQLAKSIKDKLTALHDGGSSGSAGAGAGTGAAAAEQQLKIKRLAQDFGSILQDYKSTQRVCAEREAASLPRQPARKPGTGRGGDDGLTAPLLDGGGGGSAAGGGGGDVEAALRQQAQRQAEVAALDQTVAYHEALIEERDAGIAEIQRQIGEVNEMFQDLAVLINDQGEQLRTVDEHIVTVAERVKEGQRELTAASRSSRAYRNKCLWLWLVAAVIVSVVLIILLS